MLSVDTIKVFFWWIIKDLGCSKNMASTNLTENKYIVFFCMFTVFCNTTTQNKKLPKDWKKVD